MQNYLKLYDYFNEKTYYVAAREIVLYHVGKWGKT